MCACLQILLVIRRFMLHLLDGSVCFNMHRWVLLFATGNISIILKQSASKYCQSPVSRSFYETLRVTSDRDPTTVLALDVRTLL
jgi:hypothetical protein